jgi:hypothetical protein
MKFFCPVNTNVESWVGVRVWVHAHTITLTPTPTPESVR